MKKTTKNPTYPVPFSHGGLHSYPEWSSIPHEALKSQPTNWRDPIPEVTAFDFIAELQYKDYGRGRSSATFWFESVSGEHVGKWFPVQMSNMSAMIPHLNKGRISGKFLTRKQGMNFGIELVAAFL